MLERRPWFHGLALIAGALLVGVAGLQHPVLAGDGAAQLAVIGGMEAWRTVHWAIAFGYLLVVAGLTGVWSRLIATPGAAAARTGMILSAFGYLTDLIGVLFMLGAGTALAAAYRAGEPGLTATHAVFVFDMLHPTARAALRLGSLGVSVGLCGLGWGVVAGGVLPRWLGGLGLVGGLAGIAAAVVFPETSTYVIAGVALATVWQLVTGMVMLVKPASDPAP